MNFRMYLELNMDSSTKIKYKISNRTHGSTSMKLF